VDSDTMRRRTDYEQVVAAFEARTIDVLVGTQMIAKGLDFPFVSFVGVFDADAGGFAGDFRGHERLFQLITQVAGRAGRADSPGKVVVQTTGGHELPALRYALKHDYESFAAEELRIRERIGWPPFRRLARLVVSHEREQVAREQAEAVGVAAKETIAKLVTNDNLQSFDVLGPAPCAITRIRRKYRYELLIRARGASELRRLLDEMEAAGTLRTRAASLILDVDPVSMT
jgi:primosomal protein N' (replication factor Y)